MSAIRSTNRTNTRTTSRAVSGQVLPRAPRLNLSLNLSSIENTRVEMARVYRDARSGRLDTSEAGRLAYILTQITKAFDLELVERRCRRRLASGAKYLRVFGRSCPLGMDRLFHLKGTPQTQGYACIWRRRWDALFWLAAGT
ncbi:MAG: hypothetical protein HY778_04425 [Betaproteobacteria bacterium]|nr:hypothetical protein [Betaproteobacteria bacterium]